MPILEVEIVCEPGTSPPLVLAQRLADAVGRVLHTPPGRTWVRVRTLASTDYAENETRVDPKELPVFVNVLKAHPPEGIELAAEVVALTSTIASVVGVCAERVHVKYAPAAVGRQAFGGKLVE